MDSSVETITIVGRTLKMPSPAYPPGAAHYEHQRALGTDILLPTATNSVSPPAVTAYCVWPCARMLAEWLHASELAPPLAGRNVLELGAGCGLVGLSAWVGGASVCLTDLPENLSRLQHLVRLNEAEAVSEANTAGAGIGDLDEMEVWTQN